MVLQQKKLRGDLSFDEPMAKHTSWRVGGPADQFYKPADLDDLVAYLQQLPVSEPVVFLGLGSNLLVRDNGIRGAVIAMQGVQQQLKQMDGDKVYAQAGVSCAKMAKFCTRLSYDDAVFFAGIPGTIGGALAMNAGAFGGETWPHVVSVETINRFGELHTRAASDYQFGYRHVSGPKEVNSPEWFVAGVFQFTASADPQGASRIKGLLEQRNKTQPIGLPSCGSVFTNPKGDHAARLIEACGLKGHCRGKACVSEKHANFIINTGGARAADIEELIKDVQATVEQRHGVRLVPEVRIIGEASE